MMKNTAKYKVCCLRKKDREKRLLTYCLSIWLSWSFVLIRYCVLIRVTKIVSRIVSNGHAGRRFPNTDLRGLELKSYMRVCHGY